MTSQSGRRVPLSEPVFLILVSLAGGPRHGYAILTEVTELSGGRIKLSTGTLYGALSRLLCRGSIRREGRSGHRPASRRERIVYRITADGRRLLEAETRRLRSLVRLGDAGLAEARS